MIDKTSEIVKDIYTRRKTIKKEEIIRKIREVCKEEDTNKIIREFIDKLKEETSYQSEYIKYALNIYLMNDMKIDNTKNKEEYKRDNDRNILNSIELERIRDEIR